MRSPICRTSSPFQHVVSVRRVTRQLLAAGPQISETLPDPSNRRWLKWSLRGGESRHVRAFSKRNLTTLAVSGLRNTLDLLQDLGAGAPWAGVDFVECRICDLGCIGGIATAESRFLASLRLQALNTPWEPSPEELGAAESPLPGGPMDVGQAHPSPAETSPVGQPVRGHVEAQGDEDHLR